MQKKNRVVRILRIIMPIVAIICAIVISPLDLVPALIVPLPDTVQEQVDDAIDYGLDGIIVYVDQAEKEPEFYSAGWFPGTSASHAITKTLIQLLFSS